MLRVWDRVYEWEHRIINTGITFINIMEILLELSILTYVLILQTIFNEWPVDYFIITLLLFGSSGASFRRILLVMSSDFTFITFNHQFPCVHLLSTPDHNIYNSI